jgi:transposase
LWVCAKRLESGRYSWPQDGDVSLELSNAQLTMLLDGIELDRAHPKNWYRKAV